VEGGPPIRGQLRQGKIASGVVVLLARIVGWKPPYQRFEFIVYRINKSLKDCPADLTARRTGYRRWFADRSRFLRRDSRSVYSCGGCRQL